MQIIQQYCEWIVSPPPNTLEILELIGRVAYKSEERITPGSAEKFLKMILTKKHESILDHVHATMRFVTNRGISHELVRHRIAAYTQESTRYVNYGKRGMVVICPCDYDNFNENEASTWILANQQAEIAYNHMLSAGSSPQRARDVLPHSLKTEVVATWNMREWRHVFSLRLQSNAHPQMVDLMKQALGMFQVAVPILFDEF